jgi:septum formation protein
MLLKDKLKGRRLILASGSPRRKQILTEAHLPFTLADHYEVEEEFPVTMAADDVAGFLAALKSTSYPHKLEAGDILLTADTVVISDDKVLGKPHDRWAAIEMIRSLAGRSHKVITAVTLRSFENIMAFDTTTEVWFRPLADEEIEYYVDTFQPMDKAGAYGIQEWIGTVAVSRIEGDFYNVMGMPMQAIYHNLNKFIDQQ